MASRGRTTQKEVADRVGLSRTTVSKILSRAPRYYASESTRRKVFAAAEELDYDFTSIRRPYRRSHARAEVAAPCELSLTRASGEVFDNGTALLVNLSAGGALLSRVRTGRMVLPLEGFRIHVRLSGIEGLSDLVGECEIVRMSQKPDGPEIGVRFLGTTPEDRRRIAGFVRSRVGGESSAAAGAAADE